ncbi:DUF6328 family protein [Lentzea sp. NPDC054927]
MSDAEESEHRRLARNVNELLQELRVAQAGVQILFGFLLSITFTDKYATASSLVRGIHLVTVLCAAMAVALLTAPAAWHRVLFRRGRREDVVAAGNTFLLAGLGFLAIAMTGTVLLISEVIIGGWVAVLIGILALLVYGALWFAMPLLTRDTSSEPGDDITDI